MSTPMNGEADPPLYAGRLEIVREPCTLEAHAYCPYRKQMLRVGTCFACSDCDGLAIDRSGHHSYVACGRAERDRIAVAARYEERAVGPEGPIVSVEVRCDVEPYQAVE